MKKVLALVLAFAMVFCLAACGEKKEEAVEPKFDPNAKSEGVMTFAEYDAAALDSEVVIEGFVQATQSYWNGASLYVQDGDGAYFVYNGDSDPQPNVSEADFAKLVANPKSGEGWSGLANGTKVQVKGWKSEWKGEVEIVEAQVTVLDGETWKAEAVDLTSAFGTDALVKSENQFFTVKGAKVLAKTTAEGQEVAFFRNWDNSGQEGSNPDLYFDVEIGGKTYTFTVESYLCYEGSDVYKAVTGLKVGDTIDLEGFLYWYDGANPHITAVTVK